MDSALVIVIAVVVVGLLLFLATRKTTPTLPDDTGKDTGKDASKPESEAKLPVEAKPVEETRAQPPSSDSAEPPSSESTEAAGPDAEAAETAAAAEPAEKPEPGEAAASAEDESRKEDVAALRKGLASTRGGLIARLAKLFGGKPEIDTGLLDEIEEVLITADVGVQTSQRILDDLRSKMESGELKDEQSVWRAIRAQAESILDIEAPPISLPNKPSVMLMIGVNGVGKTTTIGKLASRYVAEGKKVLLAAGDTYRAAAVLQLEMWGKRVDCPVVKGKEAADPGSVIFDAIKQATDEGYDLVIADTAGRLHTKTPLMEELKKVSRTVAKATDGRGADEVFLVLDSTTGQNAVQQTQMFREAMDITGVVLTKLDGTAKGGVILGIVDKHQVPVRFIGLGEKVEDLREFDANNFVEALFQKPEDASAAA
ncbi:MAG: signal recognition particle-docking protein FtsY [Myxococcales bacterium]